MDGRSETHRVVNDENFLPVNTIVGPISPLVGPRAAETGVQEQEPVEVVRGSGKLAELPRPPLPDASKDADAGLEQQTHQHDSRGHGNDDDQTGDIEVLRLATTAHFLACALPLRRLPVALVTATDGLHCESALGVVEA